MALCAPRTSRSMTFRAGTKQAGRCRLHTLARSHANGSGSRTAQQPAQQEHEASTSLSRRDSLVLAGSLLLLSGASLPAPTLAADDPALLQKYTPMDALKGKDYGKPRLRYPDFVATESGLQYKDLRDGTGAQPNQGSTVVLDWDGYTIGYYGRPFEARNKPKGSSFSGENKEYYRFVLGSHTVIPALEEAVAGMKEGGIRRIIVPEEIGYPEGGWSQQGPAPSTFAGQRALGFVLGNKGMIDKTLLFDIELIRVDGSK